MKNIKLLLCVAIVTSSIVSHAKVWQVNNNEGSGADFEKIVDAYNAAEAGDTIYIEGSSIPYNDHVTVSKKLIIIGPGFFLGENPETPISKTSAHVSTLRFQEGCAGSVVMGLNVNTINLLASASDVVIKRNRIRDLIFQGTGSNHLITQNYIHRRFYSSNSSEFIFENNIVVGRFEINNNSSGIVRNNVISNSTATLNYVHNATMQNNIIYQGEWSDYVNNSGSNNIANAEQFPEGNNNLQNVDMSSVFLLEGSPDGMWILKDGSPASGAGIAGIDCGAFDGESPYVLSGLPPFPVITSLQAPITASEQNGLEVKINIKLVE